MVHVLKHVRYKCSNGIEQKRTFQQKTWLARNSQVLALQLKKNAKTIPKRQIQFGNMIAFGAWHAYLSVRHRPSKLINQIYSTMKKQLVHTSSSKAEKIHTLMTKPPFYFQR